MKKLGVMFLLLVLLVGVIFGGTLSKATFVDGEATVVCTDPDDGGPIWEDGGPIWEDGTKDDGPIWEDGIEDDGPIWED